MDESFANHALVLGVRKHRLTNHGVSSTKDYYPEVGKCLRIQSTWPKNRLPVQLAF